MSNGGVCKTAPTTPGLLIKTYVLKCIISSKLTAIVKLGAGRNVDFAKGLSQDGRVCYQQFSLEFYTLRWMKKQPRGQVLPEL